jgi:hypothetical protein
MSLKRYILLTAGLSSIASADLLPSRNTSFLVQADQVTQPVLTAYIASTCGIRSREWSQKVASALWRKVEIIAAKTWPTDGYRDKAEKFTYRPQAFNRMSTLSETAARRTTRTDSETLKSLPTTLVPLDRLAAGEKVYKQLAWDHSAPGSGVAKPVPRRILRDPQYKGD